MFKSYLMIVNWCNSVTHCEGFFQFYTDYIYHAWPRWAWSYTVGPQLYLRGFTVIEHLEICRVYISRDHTYQVATPSLAKMRGSFCLVRLLKTFNPVSNPLGLVHAVPEMLLHGPVWTDLAELMSRWKTLDSLNTDRTEGLHMALSVYPVLFRNHKLHIKQHVVITLTSRYLSVFILYAVASHLNQSASMPEWFKPFTSMFVIWLPAIKNYFKRRL